MIKTLKKGKTRPQAALHHRLWTRRSPQDVHPPTSRFFQPRKVKFQNKIIKSGCPRWAEIFKRLPTVGKIFKRLPTVGSPPLPSSTRTPPTQAGEPCQQPAAQTSQNQRTIHQQHVPQSLMFQAAFECKENPFGHLSGNRLSFSSDGSKEAKHLLPHHLKPCAGVF